MLGNGISAAEYRTSRLNQHHLAEPTMTRDDVLVWLSFVWFVALVRCGDLGVVSALMAKTCLRLRHYSIRV